MSARLEQLRARKKELEARVAALEGKAPEEEGFLSRIGRPLAKGARNVAAGVGDLLEMPASLARVPMNAALGAVGSDYRFEPLGEHVAKGIDVATKGYTKPQGKFDESAEAVTRALAGVPAAGGVGAIIPRAGNIARGTKAMMASIGAPTASNIGATTGSSYLANQAMQSDPNDIYGGIGGSLVGGVLGSMGGTGLGALVRSRGRLPSFAKELGERAVATAHRPVEATGRALSYNPKTHETFKELGMQPQLADVLESDPLRILGSQVGKLPFGAKHVKAARKGQEEHLKQLLTVGEDMPMSRTEASKQLVKGTKAHTAQRKSEHAGMFGQIEHDLERISDKSVSLSKTRDALKDVTKTSRLAAEDEPGKALEILENFSSSKVGKEVQELNKIMTAKRGGVEGKYHRLDEFRKKLNNMITTHGLLGNEEQGGIKHLRNAIADDMVDSMDAKFKALGKESYANWRATKPIYTQYMKDEVPFINQILKGEKAGATDTFNIFMRNLKKGSEMGETAVMALPARERIELITAANHRLGQTSEGAEFSLARWAAKYRGLEPQAQKLLGMHLSPDNQTRLPVVAKAINHMKETLADANSSKSTYHAISWDLAKKLAKGVGVAATTGSVAPLAALAAGLVATGVGAKVLTSPRAVNWLYQTMHTKNPHTLLRRIEHASQDHANPLQKHAFRLIQNMRTPPEEKKRLHIEINAADTRKGRIEQLREHRQALEARVMALEAAA